MLQTDENAGQIDTMRYMIYWLVYKLGGEVEIDFSEVQKFFNDPQVHRMVRDTEKGIAFKVYREFTQGDLDSAFEN